MLLLPEDLTPYQNVTPQRYICVGCYIHKVGVELTTRCYKRIGGYNQWGVTNQCLRYFMLFKDAIVSLT